MAADVIKEAVIKLGIQQTNVALQAPDLAPILNAAKAATEQTAALAETTAKANTVSNELAAATKALADALEKESTATRRSSGARKSAHDDWMKEVEEGLKKWDEKFDAMDKAEDAERKLAEAAEQAALKSFRATRTAGEGVMNLTRGIALLGVVGEEDMQKVVHSIAMVQAGFDLYKGTTKIIEAMVVAQQAQVAVSRAAAVANAANSTVIGATGVVATAATPPVAGFAVAVGSALLPLTALVAIGAVAIGFIKQYADGLDEAEEAEHQLRIKRAESTAEWLKQSEDRLAAARKEAEGVRGLLSDQTLIERANVAGGRRDMYLGMAKRDDQPAGWAEGRGAIALEAGTEQIKIHEQLVQRAEQRLSLAKETNREELQAVRIADQKVQRAEQLLAAENNRVQAMQAHIGALDANDRRELEKLARRVQGGEDLSRAELERLGQLGGGRVQGFVQGEFAERGQGLDALLERVFGPDKQEALQSELARLTEALGQLTDDRTASETIAELERERNEAVAQAQTTVDTMKGIMETMVDELRTVHKELEAIGNAAR